MLNFKVEVDKTDYSVEIDIVENFSIFKIRSIWLRNFSISNIEVEFDKTEQDVLTGIIENLCLPKIRPI